MKRTALLVALMLLCCIVVKAQFKFLAESPAFEEPEAGRAKILQLKNGNTMFILTDHKKGMNIRIYNAAHQETAITHVDASFGSINAGINAVFELAGDVVMMINIIDSRTPMLYRIVIDGKTGNVKDDKKIAEVSKRGVFFGESDVIYGGLTAPDFYVQKDPNSDNYAVVIFNRFESEQSKRIEIIAYGSDNKEINRAFYSSPEEKYKYLRCVGMAVIGTEKVSLLIYGYNTRGATAKDRSLILANLDKGAKSVSFTELDFSKDLIVYQGIVRYNPVMKSLILLTLVKEKSRDNGYIPIMAFVDPYAKKINRVNVVSPSDRLNQYSKRGFSGLPQNLYLNDDGTFSIVSEEMKTLVQGRYAKTTLGDLAIVNYSKTGEFINDYLIRKDQELPNWYLSPFYQSEREGTLQILGDGNQFKPFVFLSAGPKSFVLFNDTERNNDALEKGSLVTVKGVSNCDGFYYPLKGADPILKRDYVFGNPAGKRDHDLALFSISDYDRKNNVYVTLKLENQHGNKGVKVVWLQP